MRLQMPSTQYTTGNGATQTRNRYRTFPQVDNTCIYQETRKEKNTHPGRRRIAKRHNAVILLFPFTNSSSMIVPAHKVYSSLPPYPLTPPAMRR